MHHKLEIDFKQWMKDLKHEALNIFHALEWPARDNEAWRRSRIFDLEPEEYQPGLPQGEPAQAIHREDYGLTLSVSQGKAVMHCNGECPRGIHAFALHQEGEYERMTPQARDQVRHILEQGMSHVEDKVQAWHYAELTELVVLVAEEGFNIGKPVLLQYSDSNKHNSPHFIVLGGKEAVLSLDIVYTSVDGSNSLTNSRVDVAADAGSDIRVHQTQLRNKEGVFFQENSLVLKEDAIVHYQDKHFGSDYARSRTVIDLEGAGARAELSGLYFAGRDQQIDIITLQDHKAPGAYSRAYYKGVSSLNGKSVFEGLIRVEPGATGTDAYLTNKNLLLNSGAHALSLPQLKIMNNDVKCSHGSTTSKINEDQIYYLQTRGFSREAAVNTLTEAFFSEVLDKSTPYVADMIHASIEENMAERREKWAG